MPSTTQARGLQRTSFQLAGDRAATSALMSLSFSPRFHASPGMCLPSPVFLFPSQRHLHRASSKNYLFGDRSFICTLRLSSRPLSQRKPPSQQSIFTRLYTAMAPEYKLLCLENPLLDIQAVGDEALLQKYGLKANDAILAEEQHMTLYAELEKRDAKLIAGGAAQNTARGAAYMLPPDSVLYIGAVGDDKYAQTLDDACSKAGLATEYLRLKEHPTGRCGVIITGHDRSMCTDLAAANHYRLDHLQSPEIWKHAASAQVFYVGGYHLTVCPEAAIALGKEAAARNVPFVFGMGAPFIPAVFGEALAKVLEYCDYVFQNETEAAGWAESQGLSTREIPEIAKAMAATPKKNEKRPRTVIITQGTDPTVVATGTGDIKTFNVHAIDKSEINDTNGAGDAFAGGFLAGLVEGKDIGTCVDMGMWLAAKGLKELGPSYPFPKQSYSPTSS